MSDPQPILLSDYQPPNFTVSAIDLVIQLDPDRTCVRARQTLKRTGPASAPLILNGEQLGLEKISIDGEPLSVDRYHHGDDLLTIHDVPDCFLLEIENVIVPSANTALMGLYVSSGILCTQCEAEGFRRITFYQDRPDVLSVFTVRIEADKARFPVLLSNGNRCETGDLADGRHFARWHDPHPKPAYLFALVAGDLARLEERFVTRSGRSVDLHIYARADNLDQCHFAMDALIRSMRWDEEVYGLEYDLDLFQIVAVDDFNMGAMENKGLNIFNAAAILVRSDIATDQDFMTVERIIAHEYFHNWTGNRVTCRDWFQLTLKEGLTVFRDQQFSSDMHSHAVKRIGDVMLLREGQFAEDSGPLAHPIRPQSYLEINNFYTRTVYEKGAEIIRMLQRLVGEDAYYRGIKLYFERHDGSAATCEDFVAAIADASGEDLSQFMEWYSRAGTPTLKVETEFDPGEREFAVEISQKSPTLKGQKSSAPLHMPVEIGLLAQDGSSLKLRLDGENEDQGTSRVLAVKNQHERFVFQDIDAEPVPSLLRQFTAPVKLDASLSLADQQLILAHDPDAFVRWSAAQKLYLDAILARVENPYCGTDDLDGIAQSGLAFLRDHTTDPALAASLLALPSRNLVGQELEIVHVDAVARAHKTVEQHLGHAWRDILRATRHTMAARDTGAIDTAGIGCRSLKNRCLALLAAIGDNEALDAAKTQYHTAQGMTDRISALRAIAEDGPADLAQELLADFYTRHERDHLVINKWFALQAGIDGLDAVDRVEALIAHPAFTFANPNRTRSVLGVFAMRCFEGFHRADGAGYRLLSGHALALDAKNPQVAARLLIPLGRWRRYDRERGSLMKLQLEDLLATGELSKDSLEIVQRSLA